MEHLNKLRRLKYGNVSNTRKKPRLWGGHLAFLCFSIWFFEPDQSSLILDDICWDAESVMWRNEGWFIWIKNTFCYSIEQFDWFHMLPYVPTFLLVRGLGNSYWYLLISRYPDNIISISFYRDQISISTYLPKHWNKPD